MTCLNTVNIDFLLFFFSAANYLTDEDLFPQWHSCEYEAVPENEIVKYMPPVEESCNVRNSESQSWKTLKRFESERDKGTITIFSFKFAINYLSRQTMYRPKLDDNNAEKNAISYLQFTVETFPVLSQIFQD